MNDQRNESEKDPRNEGDKDQRNEGEGSRTAARNYNERTQKFVATADVEAEARKAAEALDGSERGILQRAEEKGRAKQAKNSKVSRER